MKKLTAKRQVYFRSALEFINKNEITGCKRCILLGYSCPDSPISYVGSQYDGIILVGESPHRGWRESGNPFCDGQGKLSPSAKRIFEYLEILGKTKEDILLLEAAKCVVNDRRDLPKMIVNCRQYLEEQINYYNPKVVISFGKAVSDSFEDNLKVSIKPCNEYEIEDYVYLPLFHPSPANPNGHKKNLEFLNELMLNRGLEVIWKK